ncbi:iron-containing alcohol dehydrogenase family protein [Bacillus changyiensis]|uniref:iron-containing alcohol dehydrogenase family protein n=1 Tax=Bacillus changyiensis TaxID=3004103 RepID=UPI0022E58D17|nr:iron-containing alcohol dehydrogenase family protein [Bacillus changyiensis]MDA1476910.1 iron-containing alcohol dehydrogenase family protein [Bacillus changyiensis]
MSHQVTSIAIPAVLEISEGVIERLEAILEKHRFSKVMMFFDEFSYQQYQHQIKNSFQNIDIECLRLAPNLDVKDLLEKAFSIGNFDLIIGMGGGSVVDYGKYISFSKRIPFISVPTSASNDGFASSNCSLNINGKKTTVPARVPYGIIADLSIIQKAPDWFILAGVGDLMSNITALYDWEFEEQHGVGDVDAFAAMLSKKAVNSFVRTPMQDIKQPVFLKELVSSLTMGGIATEISGNSAPISGSEHLISHALDKISKKPQMHGIQVGIATYIMAHVQDHRAERIEKVFTRTGFFDYVKTLGMDKEEYREAIRISDTIKPNRYTYLHEKAYREKALRILDEDPILQEIF